MFDFLSSDFIFVLYLPFLLLKERLRTNLKSLLDSPNDGFTLESFPAELYVLLPYARHLNLIEGKELPQEAKDTACTTCIVAVELIRDLFIVGADPDLMEEAALVVCDIFEIEDHEVCRGAIHNYVPQLQYIFTQGKGTSREACAILVGNDCGAVDEVNAWSVKLPDIEKPAVVEPALPAPGSPTRKILQLTDIHLDLRYEIGSNAACGTPNCCMNVSGIAPDAESAAQYWGDYRCDLPHWTFKHILEHIKDTHGDDFEYIISTGDYPAHDIWIQSRENNLAHSKKVVDLLKEVFPNKTVFHSLGNHEIFPVNSYPTTTVDSANDPSWLYDTLGEYFLEAHPEALEQFSVDGFYSINYGTDFKIIGINSNMCENMNFFLLLNWEDPGMQLAWLIDELLEAELEGRKVHLLSHIPPGNDDCLGSWGREFSKIISRFEGTVMAQFYGHTHTDKFTVFYDTNNSSRPVNVGTISPSVTTSGNPGYRIYTVDAGYEGASHRILGHDTYIFNLTAANIAGPDQEPIWYKLYSAPQDLGMENLFPSEYEQLVRRMVVDDELYEQFLSYYSKGDRNNLRSKYSTLCPLLTTSNLDKSKCEEILGSAEN